MRRKLLGIVWIMMLFMFCTFQNVFAGTFEHTNEDTNYQLSIEDDASLLSETDLDYLISKMMPLTNYGNIAFKSILSNHTSTQNYASEYYHEKYGTTNGSLFLIDMDHRMIYIFSDGNNYEVITRSKAEIITDNVYTYASRKEYYTCASKAFEQMNSLLGGNKIAEPMRYISNGLVSIVLGFLVNFIIVLANSKIRSAKADEVLKNCKIKFKVNNFKTQMIGERRVYSPQSSDSGFSSGGHSSGGGGHSSHSSHSSGGGGGHSF